MREDAERGSRGFDQVALGREVSLDEQVDGLRKCDSMHAVLAVVTLIQILPRRGL